MIDSLKISFEEKPERDDIKFIANNIDKFNCSRIGYDDFKPLNYFLREENNALVGGLLAATLWQWLHIDILWLAEKYRNRGFRSEVTVSKRTKSN
ncbi:MAG: GNAT family N-acetyltransferase [Pyrinomonadaceae bacterium]